MEYHLLLSAKKTIRRRRWILRLRKVTFLCLCVISICVICLFYLEATRTRPTPYPPKLRPDSLIGTSCKAAFGIKTTIVEREIIIVDAGSTGSRLVVFSFLFCGKNLVGIKAEYKHEISGGISEMLNKQSKIENIFKGLLNFANKKTRDKKNTMIFVSATAGLRVLEPEKQENVLNMVRKIIAYSGFAASTNNDAVSILSGEKEAEYAWITANYLLGNISFEENNNTQSRECLPTMDFGGASIQVFATKDSKSHEAYSDVSRLGKRIQFVYKKSFLGLGFVQARKKMKFYLEAKKEENSIQRISSSFFYSDKSGRILLKKGTHRFSLLRQIVSDFFNCREFFPEKIHSSIEETPFDIKQVFAFSFLHIIAEELNMIGKDFHYVDDLYFRLERYCTDKKNAKTEYCFDGIFILNLLEKMGIREFKCGRKINGYNTSWPLGMAISSLIK
eukprot:GHVN01009837.1.p1 GENE.GHVN01009837.1~~GHVN01009837.1.p1  ORF type:complete len:447 (+),score=36.59 GHVN01009837.1:1-1341(+)